VVEEEQDCRVEIDESDDAWTTSPSPSSSPSLVQILDPYDSHVDPYPSSRTPPHPDPCLSAGSPSSSVGRRPSPPPVQEISSLVSTVDLGPCPSKTTGRVGGIQSLGNWRKKEAEERSSKASVVVV